MLFHRFDIAAGKTGQMQVHRESDAEEIRSIKRGEWALKRVKDEAERLFEQARAARDTSQLPERPDYDRANQLLVEITLAIWREVAGVGVPLALEGR